MRGNNVVILMVGFLLCFFVFESWLLRGLPL